MEKLKYPFAANFLLGVAGGIQYMKLKKACKDPRKSSEATLRGILEYAKDSAYGKEHHFAEILEAKDDKELYARYQKYVKPNDYEDLQPYIERHTHGEADVLFPGKPVMYATTSGTTKEPKWVPITREYLKNIYGKMTKVWLFNFIMNRRKVYHGKIISIVSTPVEGYAPDGTPYGSVSGVTRRDCPGFVKKLYTNPFCAYEIKDYTARYYVIMRLGIEHNVTLSVTANPSTVIEMQNIVDKYFDVMCDDIEKGTIDAQFNVPDNIRKECLEGVKPNPERANELREMKKKYGRVLPKHFWPDFQLLNVWHCGNTRIYLDKINDTYPEGYMNQEFGYFATECRFGLVLDDTDYTVLFPHMHYYEFVAESEMDSEEKHFLQLHELQQGKRYIPYVTTYAGMYRYNMNDLLEIGTPFENCPRVTFIQKINGIVTMTGEKLHERQFINAVKAVEEETGNKVKFFVGFADLEKSAYHFYFEFADQSTSQAVCEDFAKRVDEKLMEYNIEYKAKRDSFRVKDPIPHRLVELSFEKFKAECIAEGSRDGQFKMNLLLQDEKRHAKFKKLTIEN
ncbi:MAG: GH3 auxin-responsive promoter family protein [Paludibacteraceae bacterium]|nr:GH3 auxin-responsive promoter family protein [Paludibacteraceae bacterium]